jgi:hypothetical protein
MAELVTPQTTAPPFVTITATPGASGLGIQVQTNLVGAPAQIWPQVIQLLLQGLRVAITEEVQAGDARIVRPTPLTPGRH